MKIKTLYIIVFILAAIALIAIIYDRKNISEINQLVAKENSEVIAPKETATVNTRSVTYNQVVTILSTPQKTKRVVFEANNVQSPQNTQSPTVSPKQNSSLVNASVSNTNVQEPAGVTILSKYPTKEKIKEMNSSGIVIY